MKTRLEQISYRQYIVGFFVLAFLRAVFFPQFDLPPLVEGDRVASSSLSLGLIFLTFPLLLWALDRLRVKPFIRRLFGLGFGVIGILLYSSDWHLFFLTLGIGLLPGNIDQTEKGIDWRSEGLIMLCGLVLLTNVWFGKKWLLFLIILLVLVGSIFGERLKKKARLRIRE